MEAVDRDTLIYGTAMVWLVALSIRVIVRMIS